MTNEEILREIEALSKLLGGSYLHQTYSHEMITMTFHAYNALSYENHDDSRSKLVLLL